MKSEFPDVDVLYLKSPTGERLSLLSDDRRLKDAEIGFGGFPSGTRPNRAQRRQADAKARASRKSKRRD